MTDIDPETLELRLAWLERTAEELGDIVYCQQREIDLLRERLAQAERALAARPGAERPTDAAEERPPHY
ncbi:MAG: SlyX family protein [Gammaproteobacteria bacterium]